MGRTKGNDFRTASEFLQFFLQDEIIMPDSGCCIQKDMSGLSQNEVLARIIL